MAWRRSKDDLLVRFKAFWLGCGFPQLDDHRMLVDLHHYFGCAGLLRRPDDASDFGLRYLSRGGEACSRQQLGNFGS